MVEAFLVSSLPVAATHTCQAYQFRAPRALQIYHPARERRKAIIVCPSSTFGLLPFSFVRPLRMYVRFVRYALMTPQCCRRHRGAITVKTSSHHDSPFSLIFLSSWVFLSRDCSSSEQLSQKPAFQLKAHTIILSLPSGRSKKKG